MIITSDINQLTEIAHNNAKAKGFWDKDREVGTNLMLIVSELSEALEAVRKNRHTPNEGEGNIKDVIERGEEQGNFTELFQKHVKDTFEDEIADVFIRCFDLVGKDRINIVLHIAAKMQYNSTREKMHGKKF